MDRVVPNIVPNPLSQINAFMLSWTDKLGCTHDVYKLTPEELTEIILWLGKNGYDRDQEILEAVELMRETGEVPKCLIDFISEYRMQNPQVQLQCLN